MSIRGELIQATKQALYETDERAPEGRSVIIVNAILEAASDPNWAQRFADEHYSGDQAAKNMAMKRYFEVIRFLKENA